MTTTIRGAGLALGLLLLAACGSSADGGSSNGGVAAGAVLGTTDSDLGEIVVASSGRTAYVFDEDTAGSGTSDCSGECLDDWPPVISETADPAVDGVTGDVGTLTRDDGTMQVTLDGMPLYTFAGDSDAGDVTGQGVQDVWWAVAPDGTKVTRTAPSEPAPVPGY